MNGRLIMRDGNIYMLGIDYGGGGKIICENKKYIVVKWPGATQWSSVGQRKYYPGEIVVYEKLVGLTDCSQIKMSQNGIWSNVLINWKTERKKK